MPSLTHLVVGPPGSSPTARLVEAYRAVVRAQPGAALFLVHTRRHAEQVRGQLLGDGTAAILAPQVHDIQAFADEIVRAHDPVIRPLSDLDRRLLLDGVLADLREAGELQHFAAIADTRGFTDAVAGYVAELDEAGADLRQLLKAAGGRQGSERNRHAQAARIFDRYHRRLAKLHRLGPGDRLGRAAGLWANGERGPFSQVRAVFVAGFTSLTPPRRAVLDALRQTVEEFWIGLTDGDGEPFAGPRSTREWAAGPVVEPTLFDTRPEGATEAVAVRPETPPGIAHLAGALFQPSPGLLPVVAAGVHLIEAPGEYGEARLVARDTRERLAAGIPADRILVVARHLRPAAVDLLREVFEEYAVPVDIEGADSLARVPAVAFLLRAWRLPDEDWPFAPVAAVLRSGYFRPQWPEVRNDPDVATNAETLLRMLGEARGREAYLTAARTWEHTPPEALEDEQAEEPRRARVQRLARRCRPFLERFFRAWDRFKPTASAEGWVGGLRTFADDIGLSAAASASLADTTGLARLWRELDRWARADGGRKTVRADRFARVLSAIAATPCRARSLRDGRRVRVLSAEAAAGLDCDDLFLIGLGEGSWPDLSGPESLLDDPERDRLRTAGFGLPDPAGRLGAEQLLFLQLVTAPQRRLVLSYPAVDEQGQRLLPSSFLRAVVAAFQDGAISTTHQRMRIEGYFTERPLGPTEARVQFARWAAATNSPAAGGRANGLAPGLIDSLARAREVADARFRRREFGRFDGELRHPTVTAELARRFGPDRIFSPTALETYVACPFRFWLEHVLRLDVLEDPTETVEHTRRGAAFHRALARFHTWVKDTVPQLLDGPTLPAGVTHDLVRRVGDAVEEYAQRAPSVASRELWRLEGERLKRAAGRYRSHWDEFREPWREKGAIPTPYAFEADFGVPGENVPEPLVIQVGDVEVRIGGRIDRIDVTEGAGGTLGFWVIDYKTGRATNYSATQVERFEKLQLPLYALAVERVLLKDRPARPLGLAYWLLTDTGPKPMLPSGKRSLLTWLTDPDRWVTFRTQLESWVATLTGHIRRGDFPLAPRSEHCTDSCPFGPVCRISQSRASGKVFPLSPPTLRSATP